MSDQEQTWGLDMRTERFWLGLALLLLVPFGFLVKFCVPGAFGWWCNLYGAAILYEVFWVVVLRFAFHKLPPFVCAVIVLVVTCLLETMQLWHNAWLDMVRGTFLGSALLGTTFDKWDFVYYVIGTVLGGLLVHVIARSKDSEMGQVV